MKRMVMGCGVRRMVAVVMLGCSWRWAMMGGEGWCCDGDGR